MSVAAIVVAIDNAWQGNLNGGDHLDHIAQAHGVGKPTHGLFRITATLGVAGLILMGFSQQSEPAEATGLNHRQIEVSRLGVGDALALLLNKKP